MTECRDVRAQCGVRAVPDALVGLECAGQCGWGDVCRRDRRRPHGAAERHPYRVAGWGVAAVITLTVALSKPSPSGACYGRVITGNAVGHRWRVCVQRGR